MTKERYFEMCEMLGTEPVESEIPVELEDLPHEVQESYRVYSLLNDNWEGMSGTYLGKNMAGLKDIMDILDIDDRVSTLTIIQLIDSARMKYIQAQQAQQKTKKSATEVK